jgi:hypothetical protein
VIEPAFDASSVTLMGSEMVVFAYTGMDMPATKLKTIIDDLTIVDELATNTFVMSWSFLEVFPDTAMSFTGVSAIPSSADLVLPEASPELAPGFEDCHCGSPGASAEVRRST